MAMTKKFKVSFDVTAVMPSDIQAQIEAGMIKLCKQVGSGEVKPDGRQQEMIVQFLTYGMEGVMSFVVRNSMREAIKDMREEYADADCFKFSPATVREVF